MPIKSKDLIAQAKAKNAAALAAAVKSGDDAQMEAAFANLCVDVHDAVLAQAAADLELRNNDAAIMAARGLRTLTSAEMNYYTKLGEAMKAPDSKMALNNFSVAMPETVIDGVIGTIRTSHPLLDRINFQNTSYLTRMVLADSPSELAKWGNITDAVTKEISGSLRQVNLTMLKLSAFMAISQDIIDLGPAWIDQYVREVLSEAIACSLEQGLVDGTGKGEPTGMTRDMSATASVQDNVRPRQTATKLTELTPTALGKIVAKISRKPGAPTKARVIAPGDLIFLCNPFDYWNKIMPATSFRKPDGTWLRDALPVPADIMQTAALESGVAVIGMPSRYFVGLGMQGKTGTITQDDSVRFLEDERVYKAKFQGNAFPMDEYAFVLLDISELKTELPILTKAVTA